MICASLILGLHLASYHVDPQPNQNNINPGIYAECDGWTAGAYKNTLSRTSVYAGYTLQNGPFGISVGAVSGYQRENVRGPCRPGYYDSDRHPCMVMYGTSNAAILPMLAPHITVGPARLWYLPKIGATSAVLHLSLQEKF